MSLMKGRRYSCISCNFRTGNVQSRNVISSNGEILLFDLCKFCSTKIYCEFCKHWFFNHDDCIYDDSVFLEEIEQDNLTKNDCPIEYDE